MSVVFVAMMGVGVAEEAGLMAALIRKLVKVAPAATLTFIIVFVGGLSSVATDAGYLILIPLGAAAFLSVGRNPLAGLAAAYAGVSAGFAVNVLIAPLDGMLTEVTNEAIALVDPNQSDRPHRQPLVLDRVDVLRGPRHHDHRRADHDAEPRAATRPRATVDRGRGRRCPRAESKGLRYATFGLLGALAVVVLLHRAPGCAAAQPGDG